METPGNAEHVPHDNPLSTVAAIRQERRAIDDLNPAAYNPRKRLMPGDDEYERLKQSIQAFGYVDPIIINSDGTVIGGHQRLNVLKDLGYKEADVAVVDLDKNEEKALNIALNKISGEWDEEKLTEILSELAEEEFPVELTGFSDEELQNLWDDILEAQEEEPKAPDEEHHQPLPPMSKPGDLWLLGNHRLICGDATDEPTIERLMAGEKAAMVHTDPPYGVSYETQSGKFGMIMNDDKTHDDLYNTLLLPAFRNYCKHTIEKAAFYIWHSGSTRRDFEDAMTAVGLIENQQIVWVKNGIVLGRADYQWGHEPCFYASKGGISPNFYGDRAQHTVWRVVTRQDGAMMTVLGSGIVLTDGTGGKLCITDKPPKGKKIRYVRMEPGKPIDLFQEDRMSTVWEVSRETNTMHPCLPAGQKVYFNNEWKNIEDVKIGDTNRYGHVVATTSHQAERLVEITCGERSTVATWNHPFLVQKEDGLYWVHAELIREGDKLVDVWKKSIRQPGKDTIDIGQTESVPEWNTTSYGKNTTGKSQRECKSITKTSTKPTMRYPISNLSRPLNTSGYTLVVSNEEMCGSNHARYVENTSHAQKNTGTLAEGGLQEKHAAHAGAKSKSKTEDAELLTVGSVRNIEKPTTVYNITMSDTPAFDTEVGLSHNTQKPVELPIRAIENSSQPGEIVLDFFGGSGSTLMGAEMTGRRCFTAELDPVYCDVIISRYVGHTGNIGCTCIRDGKEIPYIELVREWAKANGEEERINAMKIPVVVTKQIAKASVEAQDEV